MSARNVMLMTRTLGHGGTERQLTEMALALNRDLFVPHVACVDANGFRADELRRNGVSLLELPFSSFAGKQAIACAIRFRRYLREHRIELIHTFDTQMNIFGVPVARLFGGPPVLSSQRCFENVIWPPHRRPMRVVHHLADGVVVNCKALQEHLRRDYSIPEKKIHVCYNGLDTAVFSPPAQKRARPAGLSDASLVIGCVCVLRPEKDLGTLLEGFALARNARSGMKLVIVGSGPEGDALARKAKELSLENDCLFFPATEDVASWLHAIDVFVLPSRSEAFSNSLMEAMGCECCVIASEVGGNPELVRHEETGLLFETDNASDLAAQLRRVAGDDDLRIQLARAGAGWVSSNLSRQAAARKMEQIYLNHLS